MADGATVLETLMIEKIVHGGAGLARGTRGVTLVPGTLPGETVEAKILGPRQGVTEAELFRVVTPAPNRMDPACPLFLSCGGCDFLHTTYARELELKNAALAETLERVGKIKPNILPPVPAPRPEFYRAAVQLKINAEGRIGLFRRNSHDVIAFEGDQFTGCQIQHERINQAVAHLQGKLAGYQVIKFRVADVGFTINLTSEIDRPPDAPLMGQLRELGPTGILYNDQVIEGSGTALYIYGEADGRSRRFRVSSDAFFQADPSVVQRITEEVGRIIEIERGSNRLTENMLDLYAGVGTFGIMLAHKVLGVFCAEISESAVADLEFNMSENRISNLMVLRGTAKSFLKKFRGPCGTVLIDPPRTGLEAEVKQSLIKLSPPLMIYISCEPSTLARDIAELVKSAQYQVVSVQMFDQFGRTHHIESLAVLRRM